MRIAAQLKAIGSAGLAIAAIMAIAIPDAAIAGPPHCPPGLAKKGACGGHSRHAGPPAWVPPGHRGHVYATDLPARPLNLDLGRCNRELIGQALGGAAGGAIGSQIGDGSGRIAAIIGGTIAGVLLGGEIGRSMDEADHLCFDQALEHAPDGRAIAWQDPDRRGDYRITSRNTFETDNGRYCREYTARSTIGGESVQTYGTACRQADGSWRIVNQH